MKKATRIGLYFLSLVCLFGKVLASKHFDYYSSNHLFNYENKNEIEFLYELVGYMGEDFVVRPFVDVGLVYMYDSAKGIWISGNDLWSNLPTLEKKMKVRVVSPGKFKLRFEILNLINNERYKVSEQIFWSANIFKDYLKILNQNVSNRVDDDKMY